MHFAIIVRILGLLLMLFSLTMLVPLFVSLFYNDGTHLAFLSSFFITVIFGAALWAPVRKQHQDLRHRDGFLITSLFWFVLGLFGALPFFLSEMPKLSLTDAIFESISGLTTTGATVITGLDYLPQSILYYRQQLQWLGGIGIIVIAVAVLPMLGIGGMQLYRAETPGPAKDNKLTPRIADTAKWIFFIYFTLTFVCCMGYWLAGMTLFDAIGHSFSTIAIGGFSTHDASMGYFDSPAIKLIAILFMFISGVNFALHYFAWRKFQVKHYFYDPESSFYFFMMLLCGIVCCVILIVSGTYEPSQALLDGIFQAVSMATTTGFSTADFSSWPTVLPYWLIFFAFIGGCAGSTGGGMKAIRVLLIVKQGIRELKQLVHPNAVIPIKLKKHVVTDRVMFAVWSFFSIYIFCFLAILILLLLSGLDYLTAFSATAASINNLGPGLGAVSAHYGDINTFAKWVLCGSMLLGRLEIFTLLVLFTPDFWRR